ncbi:MAG TPA: AAA family ATPase [Jatrophihabitans sp.]|jgi:DNA-binding CsgD family transcriptional regulator/tetratricopeptide (TPR) repeat protein|uniref:ATP-binding protein n=1 Tax=Jatrophihabitans sp. TaxID=1932789 RepID=UPI002E09B8E7|nr:AAA family ATPase [Jatrophihabitans sp.]
MDDNCGTAPLCRRAESAKVSLCVRARFNVGMLVERATMLAGLAAAVDDALAGRGRLVFVGGEAGMGKTSVVTAAAAAAPDGLRVRRGTADNITTAAALGAVVDALPELAADLESGRPRHELFRRLRGRLAARPTLLVLEDVHWADEATLDLLRYLGRRLEGLPLAVLATYRSETVTPRHPLAVVLGDLATTAGVERVLVPPLSAAAVAELIGAAGSALDPETLRARTGGNAFYVSEVLAAQGVELPATVRDAVLARAGRLSPRASDVLAAAAVLGQPADAPLLAEVAQAPADAVDECIDHGLLVAADGGWAFRHELARLAVEQTLGPAALAELNRRTLAALAARHSDDDRRLAHHAAMAGDRAAAKRHAVRAGDRAARLGAHREAAEQYRLALRFLDGGGAERDRLLSALSYACYLTDDLAEALAARLKAMELAELDGDPRDLGRHQRWVSRLSWFLGRNADSVRYGARAVATLEPGGDHPELAMAYSNQAQLAVLAGDTAGAERWGRRALDLARRLGDLDTETHALNNVGTALMQDGHWLEGRQLLERSLDLALARDAQEHAARAYTNLGSVGDLERRFAEAEADLAAGIAYCTERDLDSWRHYMGAHLAHLLAEQGRLDEAGAVAADVLRHPRLAPITAIVAGTVAAQVALRRGENVDDLLDEVWALARGTGEAERLVPVAAALAERTWLTGVGDPTEALDIAWAATATHPQPWEVGELACWRAVIGLPASTDAPVAAPFALMLDERWLDAAEAWRALGADLWRALALARVPALDAGRNALDLVDRLGAPAVREAILRLRHDTGLPVPRGPRAARLANPAALTARESEVLHLLAEGLSNADIAGRLYLSEKTVGHHVSAVLRKLGAPTRARAVATALRTGLLAPAPGSAPRT